MLNALIILLVCVSCIPYYFKYEKRKPQTRESVVLAVMIALTVASRMIFAFAPGFKPVSAMVIICGMAFGRESGFLCGSLSAVISNFFFGQGPWTPFQMVAWGLIGWIAGLLNQKKWLEDSKILLTIFAVLSGISYSFVMDIWTLLGAGDGFVLKRYIAVLGTSIPTTVEYCISNVIFLWILTPVFIKKLNRVKYKYGFFKEKEIKELMNHSYKIRRNL